MFLQRLIAGLGALLLAANVGLAEQKYAGHIHSVSSTQVVLMISTELMTFHLDDRTAITLNGKTVKVSELKAGDETSIRAEKGDDALLKALSVAATRATPQSP